MALTPAREALVVILDVGSSMTEKRQNSDCGGGEQSSYFTEALKATSLLIQQKLAFAPASELIGLVLFGTHETRNELAQAGGPTSTLYQHVYVAHDLAPASVELLRYVSSGLTPEAGGAKGDMIDALVVAMDILLKKTEGKKFQRRIFMITDGGTPASPSQLDIILKRFVEIECKLNVIGLGFTPEQAEAKVIEEEEKTKTKTKLDNEKLLKRIAQNVNGAVIPIGRALELMSYFRTRGVLQRTTFRGKLELSSALNIGIYSFIKTKEQAFPSLKRVVMGTDGPVHVQMARSLQSAQDPDANVSRDDSIKAYRYGKSLIPFSKVDEAAMKTQSERCMKLIGFTDAKKVPRQHFMTNTEMVVADPNDPDANKAFSALVAAMVQTDSYAICRYVRAKNANPALIALIPHIKVGMDCMYMQHLPFAEDIRTYQFTPLSPTDPGSRKAYHPTQEQLKAAQQLITSMDLMTSDIDQDTGDKTESLKPKRIFNPTLQRFFQVVKHRALTTAQHQPLPSPDPALLRILEPNTSDYYVNSAPAIIEFKRLFKLEKTQDAEKAEKKVYWRDRVDSLGIGSASTSNNSMGEPDGKKRKTDFSVEDLIARGIGAVGSVAPVKDFEAMLARRDSDLVGIAIDQMITRIRQLISDSIGDQYYSKALECIIALRKGCVQEDEPTQFNEFLLKLKKECEGKTRDAFWIMISSAKINPIHTGESLYSSITKEDSDKFHEFVPAIAPAVNVLPPKRVATMDDLFNMAE